MDSMSLSGRMVLHYQVIEKIGEGGMGVVYKAQDTHLDRLVALKFLPKEKTADPERRQRFIQEAKAASSLQHPNIIVVHDVATDRGLDVIVMEFVEGVTLDERIGRKGLGLSEALGLAVQIADGLGRAHAAGIIHRDLKPGNIMVTPDGRVKILDFGLAKLIEDGPSDSALMTATMGRPDRPKTAEGHILGTVAYMSPEQAEGKNLDARSDIFSFGAVLYEMIAGRPAFRRESQVATLAAIISEEPKPIAAAGDIMPPEITQLLARCLRKDPQRRWQTMSDLKVLLQDLKEDSESGRLRAPVSATVSRRRASPLIWLLPMAAVIAAFLLWLFLPKKSGTMGYAITRLTFDEGLSWCPAVSSDGRMMAYASDRSGEDHLDIWIQQLAGGIPLRLTDHPADDDTPTISPDGTRVVFRSSRDGGGLFEVGALGGDPRRLTSAGHLPRYSPNGEWISYIRIPPSLDLSQVTMHLVPARGGEPIPFQPDFRVYGISSNSAPVWSPDGAHIIFTGRRADDPQTLDWWIAPVSGGPAVRMRTGELLRLYSGWRSPYLWDETHLYYATGSTVEGVNIFRIPFDRKKSSFTGPSEPVTSGPGMQYPAAVLPGGRLFYANLNWTAQVWMLAGNPDAGVFEENPVLLTRDATAKFGPGLSRDGTKLVFSSLGGLKNPRIELRVKDLAGGKETVIPMNAEQTGQVPVISPDGTAIAYRDVREGSFRTYLLTGNEAGGQEICNSCRIIGFFSDARFALVLEGGADLFRLDTVSGERAPVLTVASGRLAEAALSPDDRWAAVVIRKPDGGASLKLAPLDGRPAPEESWVSVHDEKAFFGSPAWSPDGQRLYFLSDRGGFCDIWMQKLESLKKMPVGDPRIVFHSHGTRFQLNFPFGNGTLGVGTDKLIFWAGNASGNIYLAAPSDK